MKGLVFLLMTCLSVSAFSDTKKQCHYQNSDTKCRAAYLGDPCVTGGALGVCAANGSTGDQVDCLCIPKRKPPPPPPPPAAQCNYNYSVTTCRGKSVGGSCYEGRMHGKCFAKLMIGNEAECGCDSFP